MMRSSRFLLLLLAVFAEASQTAGAARPISSRARVLLQRLLQGGATTPKPIYWHPYRRAMQRQYNDKRLLKRCLFLAGEEPADGSTCSRKPRRPSPWFICLFQDSADALQECESNGFGFIHPTRVCNCSTVDELWSCGEWDPCIVEQQTETDVQTASSPTSSPTLPPRSSSPTLPPRAPRADAPGDLDVEPLNPELVNFCAPENLDENCVSTGDTSFTCGETCCCNPCLAETCEEQCGRSGETHATRCRCSGEGSIACVLDNCPFYLCDPEEDPPILEAPTLGGGDKISVCPRESPLTLNPQPECEVPLRCSYNEETCCGETRYALDCHCDADSVFHCNPKPRCDERLCEVEPAPSDIEVPEFECGPRLPRDTECDWPDGASCGYGEICCCGDCQTETTCFCDPEHGLICASIAFLCFSPCPNEGRPDIHGTECADPNFVYEEGEDCSCCGNCVPEWKCYCRDSGLYDCQRTIPFNQACACAPPEGEIVAPPERKLERKLERPPRETARPPPAEVVIEMPPFATFCPLVRPVVGEKCDPGLTETCEYGANCCCEDCVECWCENEQYVCKDVVFHCFAPCDLEPEPEPKELEALCPKEEPEFEEACSISSEIDCKYGNVCCCTNCWKPTTCNCVDGTFQCQTALPGCAPCEPEIIPIEVLPLPQPLPPPDEPLVFPLPVACEPRKKSWPKLVGARIDSSIADLIRAEEPCIETVQFFPTDERDRTIDDKPNRVVIYYKDITDATGIKLQEIAEVPEVK